MIVLSGDDSHWCRKPIKIVSAYKITWNHCVCDSATSILHHYNQLSLSKAAFLHNMPSCRLYTQSAAPEPGQQQRNHHLCWDTPPHLITRKMLRIISFQFVTSSSQLKPAWIMRQYQVEHRKNISSLSNQFASRCDGIKCRVVS